MKSETLNLFQNNRVNSLSLLFCHSSSNSVSIPVYFVAQLPFLPIHLLIFLLPVNLLQTPDNSNFFRFPLKVPVIGSRLYLLSFLSNEAINHFEKQNMVLQFDKLTRLSSCKNAKIFSTRHLRFITGLMCRCVEHNFYYYYYYFRSCLSVVVDINFLHSVFRVYHSRPPL